jgi:hypothetical protein
MWQAIWNSWIRFWNGIVKPAAILVLAFWLTTKYAGMPMYLTLAAFLALAANRRNYWPRLMGGLVAVYVLALVVMVGGPYVEQAFSHLFPETHDALARLMQNTDIEVGKMVEPDNVRSNVSAADARKKLLAANHKEHTEAVEEIINNGGTAAEKAALVEAADKKYREVENKLASLGDAEVVEGQQSWTSWIKDGWNDFWRDPTTEWPTLKPDQEIVRDLEAGDKVCFATKVNCHTDDVRRFAFIDNSTGRRYDPLTQAAEIATLPPTTHCWEGGPSGNHLTFRRL